MQRNWMLILAFVLLVAAALSVFNVPSSDGTPNFRSPLERDGYEFVQHYASGVAAAYRDSAANADGFKDLQDARDFHKSRLITARTNAFEKTLAPAFESLNGNKWDQNRFAETMNHIADGLEHHAK